MEISNFEVFGLDPAGKIIFFVENPGTKYSSNIFIENTSQTEELVFQVILKSLF